MDGAAWALVGGAASATGPWERSWAGSPTAASKNGAGSDDLGPSEAPGAGAAGAAAEFQSRSRERTALITNPLTIASLRNRISRLAGCTFTSTSDGLHSRKTKATGYLPWGSVSR